MTFHKKILTNVRVYNTMLAIKVCYSRFFEACPETDACYATVLACFEEFFCEEKRTMFNFLKKNTDLYAPVVGKAVKLEEVPDSMFAEKLLGDGLAFVFDTDIVYAPCDGEIIMIAATKHALGIRTANQAEVMIHIGLETVNLNGEGFTALVKAGDKIKRGQELIRLDRAFFDEQHVNLITPMVVTTKEHRLMLQEVCEVDCNSLVIKIS